MAEEQEQISTLVPEGYDPEATRDTEGYLKEGIKDIAMYSAGGAIAGAVGVASAPLLPAALRMQKRISKRMEELWDKYPRAEKFYNMQKGAIGGGMFMLKYPQTLNNVTEDSIKELGGDRDTTDVVLRSVEDRQEVNMLQEEAILEMLDKVYDGNPPDIRSILDEVTNGK